MSNRLFWKGVKELIKQHNCATLRQFASQASLLELNTLVHELHLLRQGQKATQANLLEQTNLKHLIYLIYLYGNLEEKTISKDGSRQLLNKLKLAADKMQWEAEDLENKIAWLANSNWPKLLHKFTNLVAAPGVEQSLGAQLPLIRGYLQFHEKLYQSLIKEVFAGEAQPQYIFTLGEFPYNLRRTIVFRGDPWLGKIPLLPLPGGRWLLSPELVYDSLVESYLTLSASHQRHMLISNKHGLVK